MPSTPEAELLDLSQTLLNAITSGDWETYTRLCDPGITCFEPEAEGHLAVGMPFHKYYFDLPGDGSPRQSSISSPHVRIIGDVGIVCYVRLVQKLDPLGGPVTAVANETRVWQKQGGEWKHIHFHRSPA